MMAFVWASAPETGSRFPSEWAGGGKEPSRARGRILQAGSLTSLQKKPGNNKRRLERPRRTHASLTPASAARHEFQNLGSLHLYCMMRQGAPDERCATESFCHFLRRMLQL